MVGCNCETTSKEPRQLSPEYYSSVRPKWAAGDRIYLPRDKEYATIKWIGSRQYKFIVVIQFDRPVGDSTFDSDDLPFLIERGYGLRLTLDELNECAQKASTSATARLRNKIIKLQKWGSAWLKPTPRPAIFYIENNQTA